MSEKQQTSSRIYSPNIERSHQRLFILENVRIDELTNSDLQYFVSAQSDTSKFRYFSLNAIEVNEALFTYSQFIWEQFQVLVLFEPEEKRLSIDCNCKQEKSRMCAHQYGALLLILEQNHFAAFFSEVKRNELFVKTALKYGIPVEEDLNRFFAMSFNDGEVKVSKRVPGLIDPSETSNLQAQLIPASELPKKLDVKPKTKGILLNIASYSTDLHVVLFEADLSLKGDIKNPIRELDALSEMELSNGVESMKFYAALERLKLDNFNDQAYKERLKYVKRMLSNPENLPIYLNVKQRDGKLTAHSMKKAAINDHGRVHLVFEVNKKSNFFEVICFVQFSDRKKVNLSQVKVSLEFFFEFEKTLHLIHDEYYLKLYKFMRLHQFRLLLHESKFGDFKATYLDKMEGKVAVEYSFVQAAEPKQIEATGLNSILQKSIYIEESDGYILMTPAVKYGRIEIPILTLRNVRDFDEEGVLFTYDRDKELENRFISVLLRQHPQFEEQLGQFDYFYLPRQEFLESGWFINVFEEWRSLDINVLGFSSIKNNRYSPDRMKVNLSISSGVDWFETKVNIKFGKEQVDLRALQKAIKNHARFVELGNGELGLLPEEWIKKFGAYFRSSKIVGSTIKTSKINYPVIEELAGKSDLDQTVQRDIQAIKQQFEGLEDIKSTPIPKTFTAILRDYQQAGFDWLCHLDKFNLGGCLADDMGLGKTIQILAFLCHQKLKKNGPSLIVMPTSIIFNWQREIQRFAPNLRVAVNHGANRWSNAKSPKNADVILTTYGTVISDQKKLESMEFNYIILDESQAIKNPESQRYKAVCSLQSRNKIAMTGTPIENNTFDLYAQFSFLNPGMFVNKSRFKEQYAVPIDKFKDIARAEELQRKINPFLLRRTKRQVAKELPEKTEMVFECEMAEDQRKVYDAYLKEVKSQLKDPEQRRIPGQYRVLVLQSLTKLRQICNSPALLPDEASFGNSSAKINVLMREIEAKHRQHKILVFSQFVGMLDLIKQELDAKAIQHEYLTGQSKNRGNLVGNFKSNEDVRVFLISLKAGGVGLNLTEADYVYLVDPWWNPAVENQAIDRCYRIGQKKKVVAVRLVSPNTIEEKIVGLQGDKKELSEDLIRTDEGLMKSMTEADILDLFN